MTDQPVALKRPAPRVFEGNLMEADYARPVYVLTAKPGETPEDYTNPETYAHVGGKLKPKARLEITAEDLTWYAEVMVLATTPKLSLAMLQKHIFASTAEQPAGEYEAKYGGKVAKWRVMRTSDNTVMIDGLEQKSDALGWIETNAKAPLAQAA